MKTDTTKSEELPSSETIAADIPAIKKFRHKHLQCQTDSPIRTNARTSEAFCIYCNGWHPIGDFE